MSPAEVIPDNIPEFIARRPQWVLWRIEVRDGKPTKVPYQPRVDDGLWQRADSTDPNTWSEFIDAYDTYEANRHQFDGVGYVLTGRDNITGIDLDHCLDDAGELLPEFAADVAMMDTYTEVSPSGKGVRMFAFGPKPDGWKKNGPREIYRESRFLTVTGHRISTQEEIQERPAQIAEFHRKYAPTRDTQHTTTQAERVKPSPTLDDRRILDLAFGAANRAKIDKLWKGDWRGSYKSQSDADLALVGLLAFYTQDADQLDRMFRMSQLMREKWDTRRGDSTYGRNTIDYVLAGVTDTYQPFRTEVTFTDVTDQPADEQPADEKPAPKVKLINLAEFGRRAAANPQRWIIDGWLAAGQSHLFSGREKIGKSTLAFHTVATLLTGREWFGQKVEKTPVLYFDFENPEAYTWANLVSALDVCGATPDEVAGLWHTADPLPTGLATEYLRDCIDATGQTGGVVFIDSGRGAFGPLTQVPDWENKASEVSRFVRTLTRAAHDTGWAVVLIHHNAKASDQFAGSGDWAAGVDHTWNYRATSANVRRLEFKGRRVDDVPDMDITRRNGVLVLDSSKAEARQSTKLDELAEDRAFLEAVPVGKENRVKTAEIIKNASKGWNRKEVNAIGERLYELNKVQREKGKGANEGFMWWRWE